MRVLGLIRRGFALLARPSGGRMPARRRGADERLVRLSDAEHVTDPDRAAALGLRLPAGTRPWSSTECALAEAIGRLDAAVDRQRGELRRSG